MSIHSALCSSNDAGLLSVKRCWARVWLTGRWLICSEEIVHNHSAEISVTLFDRCSIPQEVHLYSNCTGEQLYIPDETELAGYRIVVCTLVTSRRWEWCTRVQYCLLQSPLRTLRLVAVKQVGQEYETPAICPSCVQTSRGYVVIVCSCSYFLIATGICNDTRCETVLLLHNIHFELWSVFWREGRIITVGRGTALQTRGSRVRFPMRSSFLCKWT
jgi:hypothetical protein